MRHQDDLGANYIPTQDDICRACEKIQQTWDEEEMLERTRSDEKPVVVKWDVPVYSVDDLPEYMQEIIFSLNKETEQ